MQLQQLAQITKALGDPIRLQILDLIRSGYRGLRIIEACCSDGVCVCDIQEKLGMAQSKVSYHLRELKQAGLVNEKKVGKWNFYTINEETFRILHEEIDQRYLKKKEEELVDNRLALE
jgi:ArsR family transcriptional regulator